MRSNRHLRCLGGCLSAIVWLIACCFLASCDDGGVEEQRPQVDGNAADVNEQSEKARSATSKQPAGRGERAVGTGAVDAPVVEVPPVFVDVAKMSGVNFTFFSDTVRGRYFLPEIMGGGIGWLDFDGDGRLDVYFRNGSLLAADAVRTGEHPSRLFRNIGAGQFADVTLPADVGNEAYGQGIAVGDYDADGFPDMYLSNFGIDFLLRNNGDGTFSNVTATARVSDPHWSTSAVWCDIDGDHDLDLFVCNYMNVSWQTHKTCEYSGKPGYCGPGSFASLPDAVYLNQGNGTFVESAAALGFVDVDGNGLAVVAADFDDDQKFEIFVANDMTPNQMYTQSTHFDEPTTRRLKYLNVAQQGGCALSYDGLNEAGMGISIADFDGDGRIDLYITHYFHKKNTLYRNRNQLIFDDDSRRSRVAATSYESLGFGTCALDYDRDGDADIFVANGHVLGPEQEPNLMRPQLLMNVGGLFYDVSDRAGGYFQRKFLGRGVASADYDDDGDIDIAVSNIDDGAGLLRNDTKTERQFIGFELTQLDRSLPIGGRAVVTKGKRRQILPVIGGGSYLSTSDPRIVAGLDAGTDPVKVEIFWPSGRVDRYENLAVDRYWVIVEGFTPREKYRPE